MFIFSDAGVRRGQVNVGKTITVAYWIVISQGGKPRFIALDQSAIRATTLRTSLVEGSKTGKEKWHAGFMVRSKGQPQLQVYFDRHILSKITDAAVRDQLAATEQTMAREANINLVIGKRYGRFWIESVTIN
jgi:hypothetical protein